VKYEEWLTTVPSEITDDNLWRMEVYRQAVFAGDLAWHDASNLAQKRPTIGLADQLYRSVCSVSGNIAEGYSRQSGKDQARFYEYALGSAREARNWYYHARHTLSEAVANHRIRLLTDIIRLLLTIIPSERGYQPAMRGHGKLKEQQASYMIDDIRLDDEPTNP
jgi:four helix bundle protein